MDEGPDQPDATAARLPRAGARRTRGAPGERSRGPGARVLLLAALLGCDRPPFREQQSLGGRQVSAAALNRGWSGYRRYCRSCHGDRGDGLGPAGRHLDPPPRDFTRGTFKFGAVAAGSLPRDEDLRRIVRDGLAGTGMLPWAVSDAEVDDISQYLKTFSPRWREEEPGEPILPSADPWIGREAAAAARGRLVYHGLAQCQACHPSYAAEPEIASWARALGRPPPDPRPRPGEPAATDSDYGGKLLAPDFRLQPMRSVRPGARLADLYRAVAAGIGGTSMPTWKGALPEADLWALAHYLDSLAGERTATP
jgi:mono/diheme cytochrome c family protein